MRTEECECGVGPLEGVLIGMNTEVGIQRCDLCERYPGDLEAAQAVADLVGGTVHYIDARDFDPEDDEADIDDAPVRAWDPSDEETCIAYTTDPWIEKDGKTLDWRETLELVVPQAFDDVQTNPLWDDDRIQFARLLCELVATQDAELDMAALCESMDLEPGDINELFERAHNVWEQAKGNR